MTMAVTLDAGATAAILAAGIAAGAINAVVGSGTLVTFPVLLALGYPPVVANTSNAVGLVPGSLSGAYTYRTALAGHGATMLRLGAAVGVGSLVGGVLLLRLPPAAFRVIVPVLIGVALILVVLQPRLARAMAARQERVAQTVLPTPTPTPTPTAPSTPNPTPAARPGPELRPVGPALLAAGFGAGLYGGYFGAALGVILLGTLGILLSADLQWVNGVKNVLAVVANGIAAILFVASGTVAWLPVVLIAAGSAVGGLIGGRWGRRLPPAVLRAVIVVVGLAALVSFW